MWKSTWDILIRMLSGGTSLENSFDGDSILDLPNLNLIMRFVGKKSL